MEWVMAVLPLFPYFLSAFYSFFNPLTFSFMKKEKKVWAITLIAFWFLAPNHTKAQTDSTSRSLDAVVVTATKFEKPMVETGKVLVVIDRDQLDRSSGKDLSQVLTEQAGLIINGATSNPGKDKSVLLQGAKSEYTVVLIDGIPLNDPSAIGGGAYDLRLLPIDQVERVEILKGSQSTLYGSDAIAGVVNIITRKATQAKLVTGSLGYGSFNSLRAAAAVAGSTKIVDYNVSYSRFMSEGFSEAKDTTGSANFDRDGSDQQALQLNLGIRVTPSLTLRPYVRYNKFTGDYDAGAFSDSEKNNFTSNLFNTGLSAVYATKKGQVSLLYGYDQTDRNFDSDFGFLAYKGRFHHGEIFWNSNLSNHFQLLAGANFQDIHMLDTTTTESNPTLTLRSFYTSVFLKSWKGLSAEVGGRLNIHSRSGQVFTYSINPSYWLTSQAKVFVNISSGFKSPNLNQLYGPYGGNTDLLPERSSSLEGGIQFLDKQRRGDLRITAFQRVVDDVIFYSYDPVTFQSLYVNLNKQTDHGVEAEVNLKPVESVSVRVWYAYVDGEITDKSLPNEPSYHNLFRRPRHSLGMNVGVAVTPRFYVSANVRSIGQRSDLYFNMSTFTSQTVSLDTYLLLDAYAEYKIWNDRLRIWVDAKNLLNQEYYEVFGYTTQPANFMAGLNIRL